MVFDLVSYAYFIGRLTVTWAQLHPNHKQKNLSQYFSGRLILISSFVLACLSSDQPSADMNKNQTMNEWR